jgi:hypothetical protein
MSAQFVHLPKSSVFCRYQPQPGGGVAVVNLSGQVMAASFFELRHSFVFVTALACGWVVLANRSSSFPQQPAAVQTPLF